MTRNNKLNRGFIGLLMLLIGFAIIAFFIIRTDLFGGQKDGKNMIEQGRDSINEADNAKKLIEQNSRRTIE